MPDARMDFATTLVATAPSPATSGTTLSVTAGTGAKFPPAPFTIVVCPAGTAPTAANAEKIRVTNKGTGDNWSGLTRNYDSAYTSGAAARTVVVGDQVFLAPLSELIDQLIAVPDYAKNLNLINQFSPLEGVYNYKSSNTRRADQGLTNASRGLGGSNAAGYTRELFIGDSVTAGCTSGVGTTSFSRGDAWPYAMRDTLSIWGIPANGSGINRTCDGPVSRNTERFTFDANWINNTTYLGTSTNGATMTFNADRPGTVVDVFYADGFSGTFSISVNNAASGTGFASVTAAGVLRTGKKRLTGVSLYPGSTVKITVTTLGTGVGIIGVSVWSPNGGLVVDNIAQSGSRLGGTAGTATWTDVSTSTAPWQVFGGTYKGGVTGKTLQRTNITTTSGSPNISTATAGTFDADQHTGVPIDFVPDAVNGIAFPPGTYISSVTSGTAAVLSQNALFSSAGAQTANIDRDPSAVHICLGGNDLQQSRTGANIAADLTTFINTIRTQWPMCDVIVHLENELAPANASAAQELDMQQNIYATVDAKDVPLYDWRDRAGSYATGMANGIYNDAVAHMTPAMYTNLGCALAFARCIAGSGPQQANRGPILDNDVTPWWAAQGYRRFATSVTSAITVATTTESKMMNPIVIPPNYLKVGSLIKGEIAADATAGSVSPSILARLRMGTGNANTDTAITATTAAAYTAPVGARIEWELRVGAIGASGSVAGQVRINVSGASPIISRPAAVTIDTTVTQYVCMYAVLAGTSPSVSFYTSSIDTRDKP